MTQKIIAETIIQQLGGRVFVMFTGSKDFSSLREDETQLGGLSFRVGKNPKSINRVMIRLMPNDTYTVEFGRVRKLEYKIISKFEEVYCDMLQELFTEQTGLYTKF